MCFVFLHVFCFLCCVCFFCCCAFVWCSQPLFSDWCFHGCFQEYFDIDLIGDLLRVILIGELICGSVMTVNDDGS